MFDYEKQIEEILSRPITVSKQFENAIDTAFIKKGKKSNNVFNNYPLKFATVISCVVLAFSTVVFATHIIYEKVWKELKIVTPKQEEELILAPLNSEELDDIIKEEKAILIATQIIEKMGYESKDIFEIKTTRSYENEDDIFYLITFKNVVIQLNAKTGSVTYIKDVQTSERIEDNDNISVDKAIEISNNIYKSIGVENIEDYTIITSAEKDFVNGENTNKYWEISYALNEIDVDKFTLTYKIIDGNVYINTLTYKDLNNYYNNPIVITKEEAIKIAIDKEKEYSNLPLQKYDAKLDIKKMNLFIYALDNYVINSDGSMKVEDIKRNVWVVYIEHEKENKPKNGEILTVREQYNKKYYIDATTGEIIGGEQAEFF